MCEAFSEEGNYSGGSSKNSIILLGYFGQTCTVGTWVRFAPEIKDKRLI